jgi:D-glycero-D-manno-heptose 1,7-bisphosphate phosphatase
VINVDHNYVCRPAQFEFIDGIFELCQRAQQQGYLLIVITNQAGIGRGYYTEHDFLSLTAWMCERFLAMGIKIDAVYFSPFHPEHGLGPYKVDSPCRKPRPGMILRAAEEHGIDLDRSVLVGDHLSDIQAGAAAGVGKLFLFSPDSSFEEGSQGAHVIDTFANIILPGSE